MTGDPNRLLHDPAIGAVLRSDLGVASGHGVEFDVSAGLTRFESALAADLARGTGSSVSAGSGGLAVGALLLAGGLAAALGWQLAGPEEPTPAIASREVTVHRAALEPEPIVAPTPVHVPVRVPVAQPVADPIVDEVADEAADAAPIAAPRSRKVRGVRGEAAPADAPADYLREARELNAARGFLGGDAAQALTLAEAGKTRFAAGAFAQEWEGIAVLALFELGRADEARTRGDAFLQQYPNGTYAPRIRAARETAR